MWNVHIRPGHFVTDDLQSVRNWPLQTGIIPRVQYKGNNLKSLPVS